MKFTVTQTIKSIEHDQLAHYPGSRYKIPLFSAEANNPVRPPPSLGAIYCDEPIARTLHIGQTVKIELDFGD